MPDAQSGQLEIGPAQPAEWVRALELTFEYLPPDVRHDRIALVLKTVRSDRDHLSHLLVAKRQGELVASCWAQLVQGRLAMLWGPTVVATEPEATFERLLECQLGSLAARKIRVVQAFPASSELSDKLQQVQFPHAVELLYLACSVSSVPPPSEDEPEFVPYNTADRQKLEALIEESYEGTQDAPLLNGIRSTADVVDGYMTTGVFDPQRWWILRSDGADAGCLLLADHPDRNHFELVYMGLVPNSRGRGWGARVVRYAQWQAARAGREHLLLAVDAANDPALAIYGRAGFEPIRRQTVCLKFL